MNTMWYVKNMKRFKCLFNLCTFQQDTVQSSSEPVQNATVPPLSKCQNDIPMWSRATIPTCWFPYNLMDIYCSVYMSICVQGRRTAPRSVWVRSDEKTQDNCTGAQGLSEQDTSCRTMITTASSSVRSWRFYKPHRISAQKITVEWTKKIAVWLSD
jgi:hypothetical protein